MFPLTTRCGHRGVNFRNAAAAAAAGRPQKVWREGWAFWGPLENNHRRVAFFNCIYLSVLSPRHRLLSAVWNRYSAPDQSLRPCGGSIWRPGTRVG